MALICIKCEQAINQQQFIKCAFCEYHYHLKCTVISEKLFNLMSPEKKSRFRCITCRNNLDSNPYQSTPVAWQKSPTPHCSRDNVTIRKRTVILNVTTENSFDGLSDDADGSQSSLSVNSTPNPNRSFRELRLNNSYVVDELKETISTLTVKLDSAERELERLLAENFTLTKQLKDCDSKIKQLTKICMSTSGSSKSSAKNKRKAVNRTKLDFSKEPDEASGSPKTNTKIKSNPLPECEANIAPPITRETHAKKPTPEPPANEILEEASKNRSLNTQTNNGYKRPNAMNKHNNIHNKQFQDDFQQRLENGMSKRKILVVCDQQGKNLGLCLNSLYGTYFDILCYTYPGADTKTLLNALHICGKELAKDDFAIVLTGSNDTNPNEIFGNLYYSLQQFTQTNILISQVIRSRHLGERPLNHMIKHIAQQFKHCEFLGNYEADSYRIKWILLEKLAEEIYHRIAFSLYTPLYQMQLLRRHICPVKVAAPQSGSTPEVDKENNTATDKKSHIEKKQFFREKQEQSHHRN